MSDLLYFDAYSGLSGDMTLGALLHLGLPLGQLQAELAKLDLPGYRLEARPVEQHHIHGLKLEVILDRPREDVQRGLNDILRIINAAALAPRIKQRAARVFQALAEAEGQIHNIPAEAVHFHEVGAVDAIVDIVGACIGFEYFKADELYCGPLPVGGGFVRAAHGLLPVPAPATLQLLAQAGATLLPSVTLGGGIEYPARGEMVTPTGAALVAALCRMERPAMTLRAAGYGFGSREFAWPNALRLWLGSARSGQAGSPLPPVAQAEPRPQPVHTHDYSHSHPHPHTQPQPVSSAAPAKAQPESQTAPDGLAGTPLEGEVSLIEANLDDMTPENLGYLLELLMRSAALDVYFTPIQMKKNRPATKLSVLARPEDEARLAGLILRQSSTFGVRCARLARYMAGREFRPVETAGGQVQVKLKLLDGQVVDAVPEYESVAELARRAGRPFGQVYAEAAQAARIFVAPPAEGPESGAAES